MGEVVVTTQLDAVRAASSFRGRQHVLHAIVVAALSVICVLLTASPATAEEPDPGPSITDTVGDLVTCGSPLGWAASAANATLGTSLPACTDGLAAAGPAVSGALKQAAEGAFEAAGLSFGEAGASMLKFSLGWWISIPNQDAGTFMDTLGRITEYTYWIQVAFLTTSLMFLGIRLAMARSGTIRETSTEGFQQLARATVLSGSLGFIVVLGTRLSDNVSRWFLDGTVGSDPAALVDAMVQIGVYATPGGVALLFVIGILGILGGLMMAFLLLMRMGLLVVITAALPIAGAAGGTKIGSQAYEKMVAWTLAFLLFKPVGSFVIGVAAMIFMQSAPSREDNGGALTALIGTLLLCTAALVLPSLMRLIVPAVGAVGGGGSGAAAGAALAATGAKVASGGATAAAGGAGAAAAGTSGSGGMGAGGGVVSGANTSTPASFGTAGGGGEGGGSPLGGTDGTPTTGGGSGGSGGPHGGVDGTPGSGSGAGSAGGGSAAAGGGATGAWTPDAYNGGFEG